ncbi:MAG: IgGFc-binding protein [Candidatus Kapaibacterium sp.]
MKTCSPVFLVLTALALSGTLTQAQGIDSKGKDFYMAFLPTNGDGNFPSYYLIISSDQPTRGVITYNGTGESFNVLIPEPNTPVILLLDTFKLMMPTMTAELFNNTLRATFDADVTIYGMNTIRWSSDGFLALPVEALGKNYLVMSYPNTTEPGVNGTNFGRSDIPGQFAVVATENNTQVTIIPTTPVNKRASIDPFVVTLNAGEIFLGQATDQTPYIRAGRDLTGTRIVSNQPVVVYGSSVRTNIPWQAAVGRDHLVEQMTPVAYWDSSYIVTPHYQLFKSANDSNIVRIIPAENQTRVSINGSYHSTVSPPEVLELLLEDVMQITADKPILTAQYQHSTVGYQSLAPSLLPNDSVGDPFMALVQGTKQYQKSYTFSSFDSKEFFYNYANVVVPYSAAASLKVDGKPITETFKLVSGTDYIYSIIPLTSGKHTITADKPFGLLIYGYGPYNSYGFPGGFKFLDPPAGVERSELIEGEARISVTPQPILSGDALLTVELTKSMDLRATLFDAEGRVVKELFPYQQFERGRRTIPLDLSGFESGLYQCHIVDDGGASRTLPVVVLR